MMGNKKDTACSPEQHGVVAYLSLGSNQKDRLAQLEKAVRFLSLEKEIHIEAVASVYETEPVGFTDQPLFYNTVVQIRTTLEPIALLLRCQAIERKLERKRTIRWGPRTIDIDLLLYGSVQMHTEQLILPHPRMYEREFVMIPMREIQTGQAVQSSQVRLVRTNWYPSEGPSDLRKPGDRTKQR
jgi:2-amino-4-hydroxy-6-hydroxymethyldihydropteridine diphosphokinase